MKKYSRHPLASAIGLLFASWPAFSAAAGETIVYSGGGAPLQTVGGEADSLAPSGSGNRKSASLSDNSITLGSGSSVNGDVYGGANMADKDAVSKNQVFIKGAGGRHVFGGRADVMDSSGAARTEKNEVTVDSGGFSAANVYGGYAANSLQNAVSAGNRVTIDGGTASGHVLGGRAESGASSGDAAATGNSVTIHGGHVGGNVYGAAAKAVSGATIISGGQVMIGGGRVDGKIYGGFSESASGRVTVINNTVTLGGNPAAMGDIYGGYASGIGDSFSGNILNKNSGVSVSAVSNFEFVTFGYDGDANIGALDASPTGAAGNPLTKIDTRNHTVNMNGNLTGSGGIEKQGGGTLLLTGVNAYTGSTKVSDGVLQIGNGGTSGNVTGDVLNNARLRFDRSDALSYGGNISGSGAVSKAGAGTLTLTGANTFIGALSVEGGRLALGAGGSLATDALSIKENAAFDYSRAVTPYAFKNLTVHGLGATITPNASGADFSNAQLRFVIPNTAAANDTLLTVNGNVTANGTKIILDTPNGRPGLASGEKIILLDVAGNLVSDLTALTLQDSSGDIYTVRMSGNQILAFLGRISPTSPGYARLKAYAEGRISGLVFTNQGQDFLVNQGFSSALAATGQAGFRVSAFGGIGGGKSRYESGSHSNVSGASMLAGVALGTDVGAGRMTAGTFFEGGRGEYDAQNSFTNAARVKGKGDTSYYGVGALARYDLPSGLYFDVSARFGRAKTDFKTSDIQYNGWKARFNSDALYYSLHGGAGYLVRQGALSVDFSARALWTRQQSDHLTVYRDRARFDAADSVRARLGARASWAMGETVSPYVGLYWEHEFDGEQRLTVNNRRIASPSLKGESGIAEAGLSIRPSRGKPLFLDLGVQGYAGKRTGMTGSAQLRYLF
ncbi:MAG: autotransporter outer membrane beta-barrel domain-containing protein [Zoogloeaceae bacterium]|jgi:autotransporter-associated beta strand protein|nr:autotransporter outer membrane beta-barrel domain-containing protein [Zoogloeaceae bacterium]